MIQQTADIHGPVAKLKRAGCAVRHDVQVANGAERLNLLGNAGKRIVGRRDAQNPQGAPIVGEQEMRVRHA